MYWSDLVAPLPPPANLPKYNIEVAVSVIHAPLFNNNIKSSTESPLGEAVTLHKMTFLLVPLGAGHAAVPRSAAEHTHQLAGHAARAPSHVARRVLLLTLIAPLTHSPALFITVAPGLPSPHGFMLVFMLASTVSAYDLFIASRPTVGAATFMMRLFCISSPFRTVVVPLISSSVAGADVLMPTLPEASVKRLRIELPIVPDGGLAKVHAKNIPENRSTRIKTF